MADSQSELNDENPNATPILGSAVTFSHVFGWLGFALMSLALLGTAAYFYPPNLPKTEKPGIADIKDEIIPEIVRVETPNAEKTLVLEKITKPAQEDETQFSIDLGASSALPALMRRYRSISKSNSHLLGNLQGRAYYTVSDNGPVVRLRLGPLDTQQQARDLCDFMQLPSNILCTSSEFQGDPINSR